MSKTNDLRKLIQSKLLTVCSNVFYEIADDAAMYPHCVFSFNSINLTDTAFVRSDLVLTIDVWDKKKSAVDIENLCDGIEALFNAQNLPQDTILPTFFLESRNAVIDEDKNIKHRIIRATIQNYEREEEVNGSEDN